MEIQAHCSSQKFCTEPFESNHVFASFLTMTHYLSLNVLDVLHHQFAYRCLLTYQILEKLCVLFLRHCTHACIAFMRCIIIMHLVFSSITRWLLFTLKLKMRSPATFTKLSLLFLCVGCCFSISKYSTVPATSDFAARILEDGQHLFHADVSKTIS